MSHRKASKRRREKGEDDDFSPSIVPQKKRSKSQTGAGHGDHERPQQNIFVDDGDAGVRRSSRTPKPKVFDDEETAVIGRTPDSSSKPGVSGLIQAGEHSSSSANESFEDSISRKQRKAAMYDDGHKRETRRSYKDFLKELKTESSVVAKQRNDEFESEDQTNRRDGKTQKGNKYSGRRKSDLNVTPKSTGVTLKTPRDKGPSYTGIKRDTPDEASPKVRSSSRTPIPKRIFSLLEDEDKEEEKSDGSPGTESEPLDLTSPKVRSSSRVHVPKKSFPLLEKGDIDAKETKQTTPEQTSSKGRTPKLHGTKRRFSAAEKEGHQDLPANTPASSEEPSPKVRASSRGHMPKRTFSLLESDELMDETKGDGNFSEKVHKLEGEKYVSRNPAEQQKADVMKEPKKRKSSNGQQVVGKQRSASKEGEKQAANREGEKPRGKAVTVKGEDSEVGNTDIRTPSSSKLTPKRKGSIIGAKEDNDQGSSSRRKGTKPVKKKKITSLEQTPASVLSAADVKVKVEPGFGSPSETSATPKTIKSKSSSKNRQSTVSSVKQSLSLRKTVPAIKQEGVESNQDIFSLSDLAMGVTDNVKTSTDLNTSVLKGKRKGLGGKNIEEKSDKVKGKGKKTKKDSSNSGGETAEPEHIILKLHLPQSEESTKHKKHHHHHHHHHHKHKHSSGSHDDSSPKKSHHKKAAAKLPEVVEDPDASQKAETKKKRISIKFKGLSSKNIDLEMAADSPGLLQSVELGAAECSEANSPKQSMESDKKKRKSKQEDLSSSQSDSEHLKLVIKKDKLPAGNKTEVKKKKIMQPTTSQAKAVDQKKKAAPVTGSKKGKGRATPKKGKKTPQKPKVVTSYLLFCKQHRKRIAEENPGLEFTEISKKVGTAWNNLPEEEKEHWRRKADEVRKTLGLTSPKSSSTPPKGKDDKAEPIDVAAHLQLLGESLGTIGSCLRVQDPGEVHGSLSVLLDSALCAISPLLFLTSQVPELDGCSRKTQAEVLDNLAYLMPGLG